MEFTANNAKAEITLVISRLRNHHCLRKRAHSCNQLWPRDPNAWCAACRRQGELLADLLCKQLRG